MNARLAEVLADLAAEGDRLDDLVAPLDEQGWRTPTPAGGWDVAHQIAHLAWTDEAAVAAATDTPAWDALVLAALANPEGFADAEAARGAAAAPADILARWRASRERLAAVLRDLPEGTRLPWYGPPMSATSMATARFMETWAHARDVADALGATLPADDSVRHVVHIGVRTRDFSFGGRGMDAPDEEFRVSLTLPGCRRADRDRFGVRLRASGHPTGAPRRHRPGRRRRGRERLARRGPGVRRPER